jgi:hypothetical protein
MAKTGKNNLPAKETGVKIKYEARTEGRFTNKVLDSYIKPHDHEEEAKYTYTRTISHFLVPIKGRWEVTWLQQRYGKDYQEAIRREMAYKLAEKLMESDLFDHFLEYSQNPKTMADRVEFSANVVIAKPGMSEYRMITLPEGPFS